METSASLKKVINEFFGVHYGISNMNVYVAHQVEKDCVRWSSKRPIVCTIVDDTKWRIILENSWVYLKDTQCIVSEDYAIS